jgi:hypothetical protein
MPNSGIKTVADFVALATQAAGQRHLRVDRPRLRLAPHGRAVRAAGQGRNDARAVQGRLGGDAGPAGRPLHRLLRGAAHRAAAHRVGQAHAAGDHRLDAPAYLPNVPTVAESGYPGFEALNWYAFVASAKTPAPLLDRWNQEIVKVLNDPAIREQLLKHGLTPHPTTRGELTRLHAAGIGQVGRDRARPQDHGRVRLTPGPAAAAPSPAMRRGGCGSAAGVSIMVISPSVATRHARIAGADHEAGAAHDLEIPGLVQPLEQGAQRQLDQRQPAAPPAM